MSLRWTHKTHSERYSLWTAHDDRGECVAQVVREGKRWTINRHVSRAGLEPVASLKAAKVLAEDDARGRDGKR